MKFLIPLLLVLFLVSCDGEEPTFKTVNQSDLKLKAGDMVLIQNEPFYDTCFGYVQDFDTKKEVGKPQKYKVAVFCRSTGPLGKFIDAPETDLVLKARIDVGADKYGQ